jgi:simple sugar transport system permease protein
MGQFDPLIASGLAAAIPLVYAALGELFAERAGVLNLGVEGMMLVGALAAFAAVAGGAGVGVALVAAIAAGTAAAAAFAVLTLTLQASQVAAGLALAILGTGVSAFLGRGYVGFRAPDTFEELRIPVLADLPIVGPFFALNLLGYAAFAALALSTWFLFRTKAGLALRAAGESPQVARALGLRVTRIRYAAVLFGGAMAGVAGCYYAVAQFKMWQEGLTAGNGWIALALVVFAAWRPWRMALGALLFGGVTGLGLYLQATGVHISPFVLGSLPYLATIAALVAVSASPQLLRRHAPAALGKPFFDGD